MRYVYLAVLMASMAMLGGCAGAMQFLGGVFGMEADPSPEGTAGKAAGSILANIFPWFTTACSTAGLVVEDIKRKKFKHAAETLVRGIKRAKDDKKLSPEALAIISVEQDKEGVRPVVRKIKHKVENGG